MRALDIPEIAELSTSEKILFVEDLWDSIGVEEDTIPIPASHIRELNHRLAKHLKNPDQLLSLDELKHRVNVRK